MPMSDLIPWGRNRNAPAPRGNDEASPFLALQREMNRAFDSFFRGFDLAGPAQMGWAAAWPHVDVSETDQEVKVVAELPGLEEKDIEVTLHDGVLTVTVAKRPEAQRQVKRIPITG